MDAFIVVVVELVVVVVVEVVVVVVDVEIVEDKEVETEVDCDEVVGLSFRSISTIAFLKETQLKDGDNLWRCFLRPEYTPPCPEAQVEVSPVKVQLFATQTVSK